MEVATTPKRLTELECFVRLDERVIKRGFGCSRHQEIRDQMWNRMVELNPELKTTVNEGPTVVYSYTSSTSRMTAKLCTGFIIWAGKFKKRGYIFCLIEDENGNAVYWATLTKRTLTEAMVERADMRSWLCMERVRHAPFCKDDLCRQRYAFRSKYHESTGRTSYWWQCPNWKHHGAKNCPRESPDFGLPEALLRFAKKERANRDRDVKNPNRKTPRRGKFGKRTPTWKRSRRTTVSA